jgi:hypothetical protein
LPHLWPSLYFSAKSESFVVYLEYQRWGIVPWSPGKSPSGRSTSSWCVLDTALWSAYLSAQSTIRGTSPNWSASCCCWVLSAMFVVSLARL